MNSINICITKEFFCFYFDYSELNTIDRRECFKSNINTGILIVGESLIRLNHLGIVLIIIFPIYQSE
jgi:hypothetical protein